MESIRSAQCDVWMSVNGEGAPVGSLAITAGTITRRVGFDVTPKSSHVQALGPHLNLQTRIDGRIVRTGPLADPQIPIDPTTVRPGDY